MQGRCPLLKHASTCTAPRWGCRPPMANRMGRPSHAPKASHDCCCGSEEAKWAGRPFVIAVQHPAGDCILSDSHSVQHIDIWEAVPYGVRSRLAILSLAEDGFCVE